MSLTGLVELWPPILIAFLIAIMADIGCLYRARLMYSATHDGVSSPKLTFFPSFRLIFLAIAAVAGVYLFANHRGETDYAIGVFIMALILYGVIMYQDVVRLSRNGRG